jgi:hypothetical protein
VLRRGKEGLTIWIAMEDKTSQTGDEEGGEITNCLETKR